ncbi:MAG: hypothetical protein JJW03_05200 [Desulfosarcina sp.]|nr:hypothetical protein [Desulfobacterales bacterium]
MQNRLSKKEQKQLYAFFETGCKDISIKSEYWINGSDQGISYCLSCAEKEVEKLKKEEPDEEFFIDGGSNNVEGDFIPFCECGQLLENSLLDSGCNDEVDYFLQDGFDIESGNDCYSMMCVIDSMKWKSWNNNKEDDAFYNNLHILCRQILNDIHAKENKKQKQCKIKQ